MAPCSTYRDDAVHNGGAGMDIPGAQVFVRVDDRTGVRGVGAQERCGGAYGRASRGRTVALDWPAEGRPRGPVLPWCEFCSPALGALIGKDVGLSRRRLCFSGIDGPLEHARVPSEGVQGVRGDCHAQLLCGTFPRPVIPASMLTILYSSCSRVPLPGSVTPGGCGRSVLDR
jgi:hypothetical protein